MGSSDQKAAGGAVGGKSARACDGCMRRRARWYCAADDAFLCQSCDTSVHSANPLARRHERLRLRATSASPPKAGCVAEVTTTTTISSSKRLRVAPAWLKRKARTRRPPVKSVGQLLSRRLVVPEVGAGESSDERRATEEEQLLYRVPVFDPALGDFCSPLPIDDAAATTSGSCRDNVDGAVEQTKEPIVAPSPVQELPDCFASFGPTDAELSEFAADMEALLGQGLEESSELGDSFYMEALGLISPAGDGGQIKLEAEGGLVRKSNGVLASGPDMKPEFNGSPPTLVDDDDSLDHKTSSASNWGDAVDDAQFLKRSLDLRLNYEGIIESWGSSPWTDGRRPHGQLDDLLLYDHSGMWTAGGGGRQGEAAWTPRPKADGWREARVSRYREKRRTRLFAKKIRYEVRKLNAEKRPRMKGRFVKRSGAAAAAPCAVT